MNETLQMILSHKLVNGIIALVVVYAVMRFTKIDLKFEIGASGVHFAVERTGER